MGKWKEERGEEDRKGARGKGEKGGRKEKEKGGRTEGEGRCGRRKG